MTSKKFISGKFFLLYLLVGFINICSAQDIYIIGSNVNGESWALGTNPMTNNGDGYIPFNDLEGGIVNFTLDHESMVLALTSLGGCSEGFTKSKLGNLLLNFGLSFKF